MNLTEQISRNQFWFDSDLNFHKLYPPGIRALARRHWTPLHVARKASVFLAPENGLRILDIGSGVGKFCLSAANQNPQSLFFGVEQRWSLIDHAETAKEILHLKNAFFIYGNFTQLDFRQYDHFYFFNAFYENLACFDKIDDSIEYSGELFNYYNRYLYQQLAQKPAGTRLATFHTLEDEIPANFHVVGSDGDSLLKFWIKV